MITRLRRRQHRTQGMRLLVLAIAMIIIIWWNAAQAGLANGGFAAAATVVPGSTLAIEPMPFEKPGESFPGSAYYYVAPDRASANAATGDLATGAHADDAIGTAAPTPGGPGPAARALAQVASPLDQTRALTCLTAAIYYEAASEPDDGQRAVAQVVLNRLAHPGFPKTVCGVVYQGSERASGCQFTFSCDGSLARPPAPFFWRRDPLPHLRGASGLGQCARFHRPDRGAPVLPDDRAGGRTAGVSRRLCRRRAATLAASPQRHGNVRRWLARPARHRARL